MQNQIDTLRQLNYELIKNLGLFRQRAGLSFGQRHTLYHINAHQGLSIQELAELLQVDHSTMSRNVKKLMQADSSLGWKHWLTLIFPAAVLAVFAVYIVLVLKSHRLKGFNVTKRNAQKLYDMYALCASLCKIPALMFISEMMMITHNNMLMADEGWFTLQLVLDLLIIAILICLFRHLMQKMTEPEVHEESTAVRMTAVVKEEPAVPSEAPETNDTTERS